MNRAVPGDVPRVTGWLLRLAFAGVIAVFVSTNGVLLFHTRVLQLKTEQIVTDMLASVELVARIADSIDDERIVVDAHIYAKGAAEMEKLEARLAQERAEIASAARAFEPIATLPGERETWQEATSGITDLEHVIDEAIALSRKNLDEQAHDLMASNVDRFDALDATMEDLVRINRVGAGQALLDFRAIQNSFLRFVLILTLLGVACVTGGAWWVGNVARRREDLSRRLSRELEARNRELDAFAGRVAHDLRGPLTAIGLAGAQLAKGSPSCGAAAIHKRGVQRMETLIDELLTLARIDNMATGAVCDAAPVADAVRQQLETRIEHEGGTLRVEVEPASVRCAAGLLEQALLNLGENAIKYRRPGVPLEVDVRGRVDDRVYIYSVADNGIGMTDQDAARAFEPFYRAETALDLPGTGLGLSIVHRIAEVHGGAVSVSSKLGTGTTFMVRLPLARRREGMAERSPR
jgi:signal transduction histidine kinase